MTDAGVVEGVLRAVAPRALGALVRRRGDFEDAEDAMQEALLAAAREWPLSGTPDDPTAWLVRVADRRLIDGWRASSARRRREEALAYDPDPGPAPARDDSLELLFLCCHPSLTLPSQIALTLRAVGGLTTDQIAHSLLVPSATIGQRISRAKTALRSATFELPQAATLPERLAAVSAVVYLIFTEGHTASRWSPEPSRRHRSARTSCRLRSRPCTRRRRPRTQPTGRRSSACTTCWSPRLRAR